MGGLSDRIYFFSATCQVAFTMISKISSFGDLSEVALFAHIVSSNPDATQEVRRMPAYSPAPTQGYRGLPKLSDIIEALENFQDFEPAVRTTAIALYASELGVCQMHFYMIAATLTAGLGGAR